MTNQTLVAPLMVASIFGGAIFINLGFATTNPAPVLALLALILYSLSRPLAIGKPFVLIATLVLLHGLISISIGHTSAGLFLKVYSAAAVIYCGWLVAAKSVPDLEELIRLYIVGSGIVATIGMIQGIGWMLGVSALYDFSWLPGWSLAPGGLLGMRLSSILYEPSQVAFTMGPAACLALARLSGRCRHLLGPASAVQILLLTALSSSSSAIIVISVFLSLLLVGGSVFIFRIIALFSLPVIFLTGAGYFQNTLTKIYGLLHSFFQIGSAENINASTFTLYFHATTALENFRRSMGFGGGIGSHERLTESILLGTSFDYNVYNTNSAGNLTFRLFSELGIFGVAVLVAYSLYVLRGIFRFSGNTALYHAAFSAGIFGFLLRNGTYAQYGIAFYVIVLLYISYHQSITRNPLQSFPNREKVQRSYRLDQQ